MRIGATVITASLGFALLSGCEHEDRRPARSDDTSAVDVASVAPVAPVAPDPKSNRDIFVVSMTPIEAAKKAAEVLATRFGLSVGASSYRKFDPSDAQSFVDGDYFSAKTGAIATAGRFNVRCDWLKEGQTRVDLSSEWPEEQFNYAAAQIRQALVAASSQPSDGAHPRQ